MVGKSNMDIVPSITVQELRLKLDRNEDLLLLDVRERYEYDISNLGGMLLPLEQLPMKIQLLDPGREIIVHCRTGARSAFAVQYLMEAGFKNVKNLEGGINAWSDQIDHTVKKY
jgi:adenylyltransferase/sulfurtransferase